MSVPLMGRTSNSSATCFIAVVICTFVLPALISLLATSVATYEALMVFARAPVTGFAVSYPERGWGRGMLAGGSAG